MQCKSCKTPLYTSRSDLCIACAGAYQLVEEFRDRWDSEAIRAIAADIGLSAVRQVRALRTYQRGLREACERQEVRAAAAKGEEPRVEPRRQEAPLRGRIGRTTASERGPLHVVESGTTETRTRSTLRTRNQERLSPPVWLGCGLRKWRQEGLWLQSRRPAHVLIEEGHPLIGTAGRSAGLLRRRRIRERVVQGPQQVPQKDFRTC